MCVLVVSVCLGEFHDGASERSPPFVGNMARSVRTQAVGWGLSRPGSGQLTLRRSVPVVLASALRFLPDILVCGVGERGAGLC